MEKRRSVPVLISFRKLQLSDRISTNQQTCVDMTDGRRSNPATQIGQRRNLPLRSFSPCSILPNSKKIAKLSVDNRQLFKNMSDAELEIERFDKDFVLPLLKNVESDKSCSTRSNEGVYCADTSLKENAKRFHSSSDSIPTDTDSGIFSRLSSTDRDSDDSDCSIVITNKSQEHHDEYSDVESETKPLSLHYRRSA